MLKLAREMDELASDVVVSGTVPQRRLLAASCGERCLSCCAPFDMLVSLACVWSVHECRLVAWHCAWCQGMVAASPVSHTVCPSFSCMLSSQPWEAPLVNSFRFYGLLHRHRSIRVKRRKNER